MHCTIRASMSFSVWEILIRYVDLNVACHVRQKMLVYGLAVCTQCMERKNNSIIHSIHFLFKIGTIYCS